MLQTMSIMTEYRKIVHAKHAQQFSEEHTVWNSQHYHKIYNVSYYTSNDLYVMLNTKST